MAETLMTIERLLLRKNSTPISETINTGEILGLAGLDGQGQSQFLESLAGLYRPAKGQITIGGQAIKSLKDAAQARVGYMPSDRKKNGIFPGLSVEDNFLLGNLDRFSRWGWLKRKNARQALDAFRDELSIVSAHRQSPISQLSGGNQQKVLLARAMARNPKIMLLNDPTRGVDIRTRQTLYGYFRQAVAAQGMTLVILSTELDEVIELCDRVIVFRDFGVSARLSRHNLNTDQLMAAMFGQDHGDKHTQGSRS